MRKAISLKVMMAAVLAAAALVSGCGAVKSLNGSKTASTPAKAAAKPPLSVPAAFANDQAKLDFAVKAVHDGYYTEALPLLEQASVTSKDPRGFVALGTARFNKNDFTGAIKAWNSATDLAPSLAGEMQNNIGNALRDSGQHAEAEAAYRKALTLEPTRWNAAVNLATMLKVDGNLPAAVSVLESAKAANKDVLPLITLLNDLKSEATSAKKAK